ncbi:hypothetical protein ACQKP0_25570 [Heyndrickxia sp. NPDC080065]|uniref:hypothetical protein n=1 Tax=Heyndrickxia sp. NPDC080065 TaxID=3390568 RepID=UPI003D07C993
MGTWTEVETTAGAQSKIDDAIRVKLGLDRIEIGAGSRVGYGESAIAVGKGSFGNANYSIALGAGAYVNPFSVTTNQGSNVGYASIAIGKSAKSLSNNNIAVGSSAEAGDEEQYNVSNILFDEAIAIGYYAKATAKSSVALGVRANSLNANEGVLGSENGVKTWKVPGSFTVNGTKNFEMPHPHPNKKNTHMLRHSAVESPTAGDNLYRYTIKAIKPNEIVELELPDYFQYLNKNVDVWVNGDGHFGRGFGRVEGNTLRVTCELAGTYKVLVIGTRNDDHQSVQDWDIKGVEREIGESWTGETYVFEVDEIMEVEEIREEIV